MRRSQACCSTWKSLCLWLEQGHTDASTLTDVAAGPFGILRNFGGADATMGHEKEDRRGS